MASIASSTRFVGCNSDSIPIRNPSGSSGSNIALQKCRTRYAVMYYLELLSREGKPAHVAAGRFRYTDGCGAHKNTRAMHKGEYKTLPQCTVFIECPAVRREDDARNTSIPSRKCSNNPCLRAVQMDDVR